MCMYIKNFCWTETGKRILKIKEGRGGWFGMDCRVSLELVSGSVSKPCIDIFAT